MVHYYCISIAVEYSVSLAASNFVCATVLKTKNILRSFGFGRYSSLQKVSFYFDICSFIKLHLNIDLVSDDCFTSFCITSVSTCYRGHFPLMAPEVERL